MSRLFLECRTLGNGTSPDTQIATGGDAVNAAQTLEKFDNLTITKTKGGERPIPVVPSATKDL